MGSNKIMSWKALIEQFAGDNRHVKPNPPATEKQIAEVEKRLNIVLPADIKSFLKELNGDNYFVFSTSEIIEVNETQRGLDCFMPLDCLLFIAGNGCGDYLGYPITREEIKDWEIFMWDHEYDNRVYKASGLKDAIEKYYTSMI
jgi:hypothetical protein